MLSLDYLTSRVVRKKDGKLFSGIHSTSWEEFQTNKKDFDFGLMLRGCKGIATVQEWSKEGRLILEHLVPVTSDGPMELKQFMKLAVEITEAISVMHERNIMHNNINPWYISPSSSLPIPYNCCISSKFVSRKISLRSFPRFLFPPFFFFTRVVVFIIRTKKTVTS
jgi:hypothetical protein